MVDASSSAKALWDEEQGRPYWGEKTYALAQRFVNRFGFIRQQEDKEEVLHDFATKNPQMEGFNGRAKFSTWLYSCLFRQAVDFARKKYLLRIPEERRPREVSIDTPKEDDKGKDFRAELADEKFGNHPTLESLMEYDIVYSWPNYCVLKVFDGTQYRDVTDEEWSIFYQEFDFD